MYTKNYKILMKDIKDTPENGKTSHFHVMKDLTLLKMSKLSKVIYRFNVTSIKIDCTLTETEKIILQLIQKHGRPQITKSIQRKNNPDHLSNIITFNFKNREKP